MPWHRFRMQSRATYNRATIATDIGDGSWEPAQGFAGVEDTIYALGKADC